LLAKIEVRPLVDDLSNGFVPVLNPDYFLPTAFLCYLKPEPSVAPLLWQLANREDRWVRTVLIVFSLVYSLSLELLMWLSSAS